MSTSIDKIAEWLDWLRIGSAPLTVESYGWELRALEKFFQDRSVVELTKADVARYLSHRRVIKKCGDATIKRSVNAFKSFFGYALGKKSPVRNMPLPTIKKRKHRTLKFEQVNDLMLACDTSTPKGRRDLALVCLMLDSGLRSAEVCRLKLSDVDMAESRLSVRIKGGDDGDGVFGPDTRSMLAAWLGYRDTIARPGVENFFVSVGGDRPGTPLTPPGLRCIFRAIGKRAGFEKFSPHDLRRSFATLSTKLGAPTRVIQVAGRWQDIKQVEDYTRALEAEAIAKYSPVSHVLDS